MATNKALLSTKGGSTSMPHHSELTPSEARVIRLYQSIPEAGRPAFFRLMETICAGVDWSPKERSLSAVLSIGDRS